MAPIASFLLQWREEATILVTPFLNSSYPSLLMDTRNLDLQERPSGSFY